MDNIITKSSLDMKNSTNMYDVDDDEVSLYKL